VPRTGTPRITALTGAVLLTGTALLMLAGCADSGGGSTSTASGMNAAAGSPAHAPAAADVRGPAFAGQSAGSASLDLVPVNQSIIYTASLTLRVRDVSTASAAVSSYVTTAGGYTADEQARASEPGRQRPTISLTLKVPSGEYPAVLRHLSGLGHQTSLTQRSTDVTQQVADVNSRVTSERDAIAQLRALLKRAGSVSGLLQVQQQISGDESSLEALLAQQRALSHETAYATITLRLYGPLPAAAHRHQARHGFGSGLAAGWRGLKAATGWVLTALGVLAPFLLVLAVIGGLAYLVRRRLSRRGRNRAPAAGAS
jgi:hypothetical protein